MSTTACVTTKLNSTNRGTSLWRRGLAGSVGSGAILAVLCLAGCSAIHMDFASKVWVEEERSRQLEVEGVRRLSCKTHNGQVAVTGGGGQEAVRVVAHIRARGRDSDDARRCLEAIDLVTDVRGEEIVVRWKWTKRRRRWHAQVSYTITQPEGLDVIAETHNGGIVVSGIQAGCDATTHNGPIELTDCAGDVSAHTHNGGIRFGGACPSFRVVTHNGSVIGEVRSGGSLDGHVTTHNGRIELTVSPNASAQVEMASHNGSLASHVEMNKLVKGRHSLRGTLGEGNGQLELATHNGSIRLVPASAPTDVNGGDVE